MAPKFGRVHMETMRVDALRPALYNPRKITPRNKSGLTTSVTQFGLVEPIVVNIRNNTVVGGHQRLDILVEQGVEETDVVIVDLDPTQERMLNIALNNPHSAGSFNEDLHSMLEQLRRADEELYSALNIDDLAIPEDLDPDPDGGGDGDGDEQPGTKPGIVIVTCRDYGEQQEIVEWLDANGYKFKLKDPEEQ